MRRELLSPNWRGLERRSAVRSGYWWRTESAGNKGESSQLDGTIVDIMWSVLPTLFQMRALVRHRYCPHSEPLQWPKLPRFWFFKGLVWPRHLSNSIYTLEHRRALAEDVLFLHFLFPTRRQNRRRRNPLLLRVRFYSGSYEHFTSSASSILGIYHLSTCFPCFWDECLWSLRPYDAILHTSSSISHRAKVIYVDK